MKLYHGSNLKIATVDLSKCRPYKDFGQGFYLTDLPEQAQKMAQRVARIYGGTPVVTCFELDMDEIMNAQLSIRTFDVPDKTWAMFVMNNRSRAMINPSSLECNLNNQYDVVIGPVANDDLALLFRQFEEGLITVDVLVREMEYKRLTSQYSFHSPSALAYLRREGVL